MVATRIVFVYSPERLPQLYQWLRQNKNSEAIRNALVERLELLGEVKQLKTQNDLLRQLVADGGIRPLATLPSGDVVLIELDEFDQFDGFDAFDESGGGKDV